MQPKRTRNSKPKLFQCQGYGDCNMVFTRSEHLARHARKHTGEKPFICIVPECNKAFSRFDNMMQHAQTHNKNTNHTACLRNKNTRSIKKRLNIQTNNKDISNGLVSPVSLSSLSPKKNDISDDEVVDILYKRRLSIADLCNPTNDEKAKIYNLTKDEFEALEGFDRFANHQKNSSLFFQDLIIHK